MFPYSVHDCDYTGRFTSVVSQSQDGGAVFECGMPAFMIDFAGDIPIHIILTHLIKDFLPAPAAGNNGDSVDFFPKISNYPELTL